MVTGRNADTTTRSTMHRNKRRKEGRKEGRKVTETPRTVELDSASSTIDLFRQSLPIPRAVRAKVSF